MKIFGYTDYTVEWHIEGTDKYGAITVSSASPSRAIEFAQRHARRIHKMPDARVAIEKIETRK